MEAEQEIVLHNLRRNAIQYIRMLDIENPNARKEVVELLDTLDTLTKQHRETKKALNEKLAAGDDGVAVTMFDVLL